MSKISFTSDEQRVSYGFGLQFGQQLQRNNFEGLDLAMVSAGIRDLFERNDIQVTDEELNQAFSNVQRQLQEKQEQKARQMAELGKSFLAENSKREGVITLENGLQYEVLENGNGATPNANSEVVTHYHGTFIDGTVFDSSVDRGEPATFGVSQVISGWTQALQLMKTGDKWRVFLPSHLAYGDMGAPPSIPGGAALVFEIHLIDIVA